MLWIIYHFKLAQLFDSSDLQFMVGETDIVQQDKLRFQKETQNLGAP